MSTRPNDQATGRFENMTVRIVTVCAFLAFGGAYLIRQVRDDTNRTRDLKELKETVAELNDRIVGKSQLGWHRPQEMMLMDRLQADNPELKVPRVTETWPPKGLIQ